MIRRAVFAAIVYLTIPLATPAAIPLPHWVWPTAGQTVERSFDGGHETVTAQLQCAADFCHLEIAINGGPVQSLRAYSPPANLDVSRHLKAGSNSIAVSVKSTTGPSAFALRLKLKTADGRTGTIVTDSTWKGVSDRGPVNDRYWGFDQEPVAVSVFDDYDQWRRARNAEQGTAASNFQLLPGYEISLVRSAAKDEDSWIAMDFDPKGRLVVAREKTGLLRLTLKDGKVGKTEVISEDLAEIRGVLFAHGALYVNSNSHNLRTKPRDATGGLYRLRDTTGDDQFDEIRLLGERTATGGHGRNDLTLGPDGKIYLIGGDSVGRPDKITDLTPPIPNQLPGDELDHGHVVRTDKDGKEWELVCAGLRNPYGIDFNPDGEMFTFDADAEFDMGAPWYRPTRVRQLVRGADYGWRRVTGKWPPYYPDHIDEPPLTLNIGKSSPTSVKFGAKSHFPDAYAKALFILDWTYGRILAVHMTPRGAGYQCRTEQFLRGRPANVTDLAFGPDGAMYFVTGGRGTQSGLYRVRHTGAKRSAMNLSQQEQARNIFGKINRRLRKRIATDPALADRHLDNPDPWIRYASRTALEHSPKLDPRRLTEIGKNADADLAYLTALARRGARPYLAAIPERLNRFAWKTLTERQKLELVRVHELCRLRLPGNPALGLDQARRQLAAAYPDSSAAVNQALCSLLADLKEPSLPAKTMPLLLAADTPQETIHFLFHLRNLTAGWNPRLRRQYFSALRQTSEFRGGRGLPTFLDAIRDDALKAVPEKERAQYAALVKQKDRLTELLKTVPTDRPFVREWKLGDFGEPVRHPADPRRGRAVYTAASCILCHQMGGQGRVFGPDLTNVAGRFSRRDLLESIINPSKVVAEKYRNVTILTKDGATHTGRVIFSGDYRLPDVQISSDPLRPDQITRLAKSDITETRFSDVSAMPEGLLNSLNKNEILDLLAYLESGDQ